MKKQQTSSHNLAALLLVTTSWVIAPMLSAESGSQTPGQRIAAIHARDAAQSEYITGLREALQKEKRNSAWADKKETELLNSYEAQASAPRGGLRSVECRSSKCSLVVQLNEESPKETVEQQDAITQWISNGQSCAYTMSSGPGIQSTAPALQMFLDCK
jgi:hypothetical protein